MREFYTDNDTDDWEENFMNVKNIYSHLRLVLQHKWRVFINCAKCGLPWRGFMHDMSKFSPIEFFESAKYFQGNRSPITASRQDIGYSEAWLHHKGILALTS